MESSSGKLQPSCPPVRIDSGLSGLLVSRDLIFVTKIKETAADLGYVVLVASTQSAAVSMITAHHPSVVLVDLTAGEMATSGALKAYKDLAGAGAWLIAFGPHVDTDALAAANSVGFHVVLPRSVFTVKLSELLQRYFSEPPPKNV
jgi:CheY-like chemotaxis protein